MQLTASSAIKTVCQSSHRTLQLLMHCAMHTLMLRIRYSTRRSAVPELALGLYPIHPILQSVTIVLGLTHTSGSVEVVTV